MDFIEEKIREAIENEASRQAAIAEAAGAIAPLRGRLGENGPVQAQFMLVFDAQLYEPHATPWWAALAGLDRVEFEKVVAGLVGSQGVLSVLRKVAAAASEP